MLLAIALTTGHDAIDAFLFVAPASRRTLAATGTHIEIPPVVSQSERRPTNNGRYSGERSRSESGAPNLVQCTATINKVNVIHAHSVLSCRLPNRLHGQIRTVWR
jgi:hypothetical protein